MLNVSYKVYEFSQSGLTLPISIPTNGLTYPAEVSNDSYYLESKIDSETRARQNFVSNVWENRIDQNFRNSI